MTADLFRKAKRIQEERDVIINASVAIQSFKSFDIDKLPYDTKGKVLKVLQEEIDRLNKEFENL